VLIETGGAGKLLGPDDLLADVYLFGIPDGENTAARRLLMMVSMGSTVRVSG